MSDTHDAAAYDAASSAAAPAAATHDAATSPRGLRKIWRNDTWVRPYFRRYGKVMAWALFLGIAAFIFSAALMFTSGYMISLAAALPLTVLAIHVPSIFVRIFGIGKPILGYFERLTSHDWVFRMTSDLRRRLYRSFEKILPTSSERVGLGRAHALLTDDIGHVQNLYLRTIFPLICAWIVCVIVIIAAGVFSLPLALALLVLLGVEVVVVPLVSVCVNGARMLKARELHAHLYDELTDDVLGVQDWVLSGRRDDYLDRHQKTDEQVHRIDAAVKRSNRIRDIIVQVIFGLCAVVIIVWAGDAFSLSALADQSSAVAALGSVGDANAPAYAPNWIAAFVLCFFPLIEAFEPASDAALGLVTHSNAVAHLNDLPDPGDDIAVGKGNAEDKKARAKSERTSAVGAQAAAPAASKQQASTPPARTRTVPDIVCSQLAFRYEEGERDVLHDINLTIPAGQKVSVLGRSGAGKTTLALLIAGEAAPSAGYVHVGGRDAFDQRDPRLRRVSLIEQHPHLFNMTLRDNLLIGRARATDDDITAAMEAVGLGDLLRAQPHGLDTMVDESGRRFSGGERHRIALARVLLARTDIVIFDEPFTGLDPATERALLETILRVLADKTVIVITHHLQGVTRMDRAVFIEDGSITIDGDPRALAHDNARFQQLLAFERGLTPMSA